MPLSFSWSLAVIQNIGTYRAERMTSRMLSLFEDSALHSLPAVSFYHSDPVPLHSPPEEKSTPSLTHPIAMPAESLRGKGITLCHGCATELQQNCINSTLSATFIALTIASKKELSDQISLAVPCGSKAAQLTRSFVILAAILSLAVSVLCCHCHNGREIGWAWQ